MMSGRDSKESDSDLEIEGILERDNTKKKGWISKQKLIKICQKEVGKEGHPLNIAIIGPPGCGKSSLLNTIFAAFSDEKWREIAAHGNFDTESKQVSKRLISYPKKKYYTRKSECDEDDNFLMPTFIDVKGFEDNNNDFNKELLNIVFNGRMKEYGNFSDVLQCFQSDGINGLKRKYGQHDEYLKVDRIIFVCSGNPEDPLPTQLMDCVSEVSHGVRGIPLFGVMTKVDKFDGRKDPKVKEREEKFRKHLGIPLNRFERIKNYCEDIDEKTSYKFGVIPQLDVKVLTLMTQVFQKCMEVVNPEGDPYKVDAVPVEPKKVETAAHPISAPVTYGPVMGSLLLLFTIQMLLVAMLLHFGMKPVVSDTTMNTICASYDMIQRRDNVQITGLSEMCNNKVDVLKPPITLLGAGLFIVIVIVPVIFYSIMDKIKNK